MREAIVLEEQKGLWIEEWLLRQAQLGERLRVMVRMGEIRILPMPAEPEREVSPKGWEVFRSLGRDAQPGQLPNAAIEHDRYLYGKSQ